MTPLAKRRYAALAILSPVVILILWMLLTFRATVPAVILPSPFAVAASLWDMVRHGYSGTPIGVHLAASPTRVGVAFALAPFAVLLPIPPLGLIPLFILWFGIGELSKIVLIFLFVLLITMVNAQAGANALASTRLALRDLWAPVAGLSFRRSAFSAATDHDRAARGNGNGAHDLGGLGTCWRRSRARFRHPRCQQLFPLGHDLKPIDFALFEEAGRLVFQSAMVSERLVDYAEVFESNAGAIHPAVRAAIKPGVRYTAREAFEAIYSKKQLQRQARALLADCAALVVPTVPTIFTIDASWTNRWHETR
jgi:hypothetical protein